jgi:multiple sugar transport system substrate-binding protein
MLMVLLVSVLAFATGTTEEAAEDEEVVLRFSWWGGETRHNALLAAMDLFMERNPTITVEGEFSGWSGYIDKLRTQMAAGQQPDVYYNGLDGPWQVLPIEARADLNDFAAIQTDQLAEAQLEQVRLDGELLGLPRSASVRGGYLINGTLFAELGIEIPDYEWTWDDFASIAQEVYDSSDGDVFGTLDETGGVTYGSFGSRAWMLSHFGVPLTNPEGLAVTEEQLGEFYSWWADLRERGAASSAEVSVSADDNQNSPIVTGKVGMLALSLGSYARFQSNTTDNLVFVPFPQGEYNNNELAAGVIASLSSASENQDEAAEFLDFIINDVEAGLILGTEVGIPANAERREALLEAGLDEAGKVVFTLNNWIVDNLGTVSFTGTHEKLSEFRDLYWAEEQRMAFGRATVEETVDAIVDIANQLGIAIPDRPLRP